MHCFMQVPADNISFMIWNYVLTYLLFYLRHCFLHIIVALHIRITNCAMVHMSPILNPPPSPSHPSGHSSALVPYTRLLSHASNSGSVIYFIYDNIYVSVRYFLKSSHFTFIGVQRSSTSAVSFQVAPNLGSLLPSFLNSIL